MDEEEQTKKVRKTFKEKWNEVDETCPHCKSITKINRGLTKQNLNKLVFGKPTVEDWMLSAIIALILFSAWAYYDDTKLCKDAAINFETNCIKYYDSIIKSNASNYNSQMEDISYFILNYTSPEIITPATNQNETYPR